MAPIEVEHVFNCVGNTGDTGILSEVRDCGKLIQWIKERGILQTCCFVILLLFKEMQMSMTCFSAIPHLRRNSQRYFLWKGSTMIQKEFFSGL